MKIERQIESPKLWTFAREHLPRGLVAANYIIGYGRVAGIYAIRPEDKPGFFARMMAFTPRDPIAEIHGATIFLYHPEYFSDFEDLARKYESETGYEVTLKYWQAPKDAPKHAQ